MICGGDGGGWVADKEVKRIRIGVEIGRVEFRE